MIEINLLPQESKAKTAFIGKISLESKYLVYFFPLLFAVLIFIQISLLAVGMVQAVRFKTLDNKWKGLTPQREKLNNLKKASDILNFDAKIIQELSNRRQNWSQKLNRMSLDLVGGIWFNEILLSQKELVLKASVVSLQKDEMSLINRFINTLKDDVYFFKDFSSLELGLVQRKSIAAYDVIDFVATAKLKAK